jgi:hypothetical protein
MEDKSIKQLRDGSRYNAFIPKARLRDITVVKKADLRDTLRFIPQVVKTYKWQTIAMANQLRGRDVQETCRNIWEFFYWHVAYKKDESGKEQIRTFSRLWHDKLADCDCFTTSILSMLDVLNIKALMRITKYEPGRYQHIYPVVILPNGNHIIMDCVTRQFNYEEPYYQKEDYNMELQLLDGIDPLKSPDAYLFGELGKRGKRSGGGSGASAVKRPLFKKSGQGGKRPIFNKGNKQERKENRKQKIQNFKQRAGKVINKVNKANPATLLLRTGILAALKLNVMKVASKLRWSYLTPDKIAAKGGDANVHNRLLTVRTKLENILFAAGGNKENMRKAILTGNGNKNGDLAGYLIDNPYAPLSSLLGTMFREEAIEGVDEFAEINGISGIDDINGLGSAAATTAALTAASGVIGSIAILLKGIGNLFPKAGKKSDFSAENQADVPDKNEESESTNSQSNSDNGNHGGDGGKEGTGKQNLKEEESKQPIFLPRKQITTTSTSTSNDDAPEAELKQETPNLPSGSGNNSTNSENSSQGSDTGTGENQTDENSRQTGGEANGTQAQNKDSGANKETGLVKFWADNKKWIKPVGIGLGAIGVLYVGYQLTKGQEASASAKHKSGKSSSGGLNGIRHKKKKSNSNAPYRTQQGNQRNPIKSSIDLM